MVSVGLSIGLRLPGVALLLAVLAGAALIVLGQKGGAEDLSASKLGWIALALLAGAVLPVQGAMNALPRQDLGGAPSAVGAVSLFIATLAMAAALLATLALSEAPRPSLSGVPAMPWRGWLGGFAGAIYVVTVFAAIPPIGAAAVASRSPASRSPPCSWTGSAGSGCPSAPFPALRLAGVALLLAGIAVIKIA